MSSEKPITITLFHANWCGHCNDFMPIWDSMKECAFSQQNIEFIAYEQKDIEMLDDTKRIVNGIDVRSLGYPSIKINVNDKEYIYKGSRSIHDIYTSIIKTLRNTMDGISGTLSVSESDAGINISTSDDLDESDKRVLFSTSTFQRGGSGSVKTTGSNKSIFGKRLNDNDFKSFVDADTFSTVIRKINKNS